MADKRDILVRLLGEETVSKMSDRAGDGLDRFGDKLVTTEKDAKDLDRQISEVERDLKLLAVAFARTGDAADRVDITRAIRRQQAELRRLTKAKDLLPDFTDEGSKSAIQTALGFAKHLPTALRGALASGPGGVVGGILAAWFVPTLSAAAAGAIIGGVGAGGVIGGIALAAKDTRVQAAGKALGETVMADLDESASRFVSPTIAGIGIIRSAWTDVADDVDAVFQASARYVEPLARGVADFVRQITPGIRKAAEAAGPVIREIGEGLPRLGRAIGDALSDFADDADEGASAIRYVFQVVETGIGIVGGAIHAFAGMYRAVLDIADAAVTAEEALLGWNPIFKGTIAEGRRKVDELKGALDRGGDAGSTAGDKVEGGLLRAGTAADVSAEKIQTWADVVRDSTNRAIASENANIRLEQAIDDAAEAAKEGAHKGIDPNTEAGRKNRLALLGIAEAANAARDDILENTGSQELATAATERGRKKFLEAATAMGVSKKEAKALADKLFGIPKSVSTEVTQPGMGSALENAKLLKQRVDDIDRRIDISAKFTTSYGGAAHSGFGYSTGYSSGGYVDGMGPKGVDSVRAMLAPGEGVFTADEVDAVGGRAGFERLRAAIRSGREMASSGIQSPPGASGPAPTSGGLVDPSALTSALRAAFAELGIQVFIGDQELRGMVRVEVADHNRDLRRRVGAGAGRV